MLVDASRFLLAWIPMIFLPVIRTFWILLDNPCWGGEEVTPAEVAIHEPSELQKSQTGELKHGHIPSPDYQNCEWLHSDQGQQKTS